MGKVLQTLSINLEANTATFSDAMTKASQISLSSAKNIQKSFLLVSGAAIAAGTAVAGALAGIVVKATEYASSIELMAQKTNISTETLSKLSYASVLTGGNLDDLGGMLVKFNKSAADSASGNAKAQAAFTGLGVSVTDSAGRFRPAGQVLEDTLAKLSAMPDGLKKTQTEMTVFGRSGAALAPILKVLGTNAAQTASDMKTFGLTMSQETAEGAEHLSQTYERTKLALTGFGLTIFTAALPALQALADKVVSLAQDGSLQRWATTLGGVVTSAAHAASDALQFLSDHGHTLKVVIEGLIALEVASWLPSINTKAVAASGGIDLLAASVGKAALKMSGLTGIATAISAIGVAAKLYVTDLIFFARAEGIVATATEAITVAWKGLTAAIVSNPVGIALGLLAAGAYVFYKALHDDVLESAKLGDAAVTWHDYWHAAIDNTVASLAAMKKILGSFSIADIQAGVAEYKAIPSYGRKVHDEANVRGYLNAPDLDPKANGATGNPLQPKPTMIGGNKPDPYKAELAKLNQELTNSQLALNAAMQNSVDAQRQATEAGKAGLIITELQTKLKRQLSGTEKGAITSAITGAGENTHDVQVIESLRQRTDAAKDALATTQALALVIGEGAAADDNAKRSIDAATLARQLGVSASSKYSDAIKTLLGIEAQAAKEARELSAAHDASDLRQSASDTDALAYATLQGAGAVEQMNLALKVYAAQRAHQGDNVAVTKELTDAIVRQAEAERKLQAIQQGQAYTSPLAQYQMSLQAIAKASQDAKAAGVNVDDTQVWMANREAALRYQEQVEKIHSVFGSAADGARDFFTDLRNQTMTAATMMHDVVSEAFNGLNDNLVKILTGQKTAFASFFRGIGESVAKMGIQKLEQSIVASIMGPDKSKSDPALSVTNNKLDIINGSILSLSGKGVDSIADSTSSSLVSDASSAIGGGKGWLSGLAGMASSFIPGMSGMGSLFSSLFGGHRALGGSVQAGMSYDVGEMGRETFVPKTDGTIIPNNRTQSSAATYNVQVANGVTPEQMHMYTRSTLQQVHPQVVRDSAKSQRDQQSRRPLSAR